MSWRAPWLRERLLLLVLALCDLLVVLTVYSLNYWWRVNAWPGLTQALLVLIVVWLGGSYLLGRYTQNVSGLTAWRQTVLLAFGVLALFVLQAWLVGIGDTGTRLRSFLLPLLTGIAVGSGFVQFSLAGRSVGKEKVVLICATHEQTVLQNEINFLTTTIF